MQSVDVTVGAELPSGFRTGHWTNDAGTSGCTVVVPPPGNVTAIDMRGAAPGSRETAALDVTRARTEVHGIVLSGGSAFGLAAADGVMAWLEERRIGFHAGPAVIPIVPTAVIFDLAARDGRGRPDRAAGYAACDAAAGGPLLRGRIGAGTGATAGKWAGVEHFVPCGIGAAVARAGDAQVAALAVVNPAGDVVGDDGAIIAGTRNPNPSFALPPPQNTVLAVVAFEAAISKAEAAFVAARGSDGITRSVRPAHTRYDGDCVFAVASLLPSGSEPPRIDVLGVLATEAVAAAVRDAASFSS